VSGISGVLPKCMTASRNDPAEQPVEGADAGRPGVSAYGAGLPKDEFIKFRVAQANGRGLNTAARGRIFCSVSAETSMPFAPSTFDLRPAALPPGKRGRLSIGVWRATGLQPHERRRSKLSNAPDSSKNCETWSGLAPADAARRKRPDHPVLASIFHALLY
jgi:hypothetical protein